MFGATDAALAGKSGDDIFDEAIRGGVVGAVLGPLARIRFVAPVLVAFGTAAGISGTLDSIEQGNYAQAVFRAAFTLIGIRTFVEAPQPETIPTGGRLGSAETRAQIADLAQTLKSRGWRIVGGGGEQPEEHLPPIGGGRKGGNYIDITATKNGVTLRVNTISTLADGVTPTKYEAAAALIRSKIGANDPFLLIPKN